MGTLRNDNAGACDADTVGCHCIPTMSTGAKAMEPHCAREVLESTRSNVDWRYQWRNLGILRLDPRHTSNRLHVECADEPKDQRWHLLLDGHGLLQWGLCDCAHGVLPETLHYGCHLAYCQREHLGCAGSVGWHYSCLRANVEATFPPGQTQLVWE